MEKAKLYKKLYKRIGMTVFEKEGYRRGFINSFTVLDNPDGTFSVNYLISFGDFNSISREYVHESKLVLVKGTEI
jgi:hypothetical protein